MGRFWKQGAAVVTLALAVGLWCLSVAAAKPPGDGGGGSSPPPARFSVFELPLDGNPSAISEPDGSGVVTVAVDSSEAGYVSAAFARVKKGTTPTVVASGFLPEPLFMDPNDRQFKNGWSEPADVNLSGDIVGTAATYDPNATGDPSPGRATLWLNEGGAYSLVLLPLLAGSTASRAYGINDRGNVVGSSYSAAGSVAVLWDAQTETPVNLNSESTDAQGWQLIWASDINEDGLIVGRGIRYGAIRGFLLDRGDSSDPADDLIWAVPLVGPATAGDAWRINAAGCVIGDAWTGDGDPWGTDADYVRGFSWDGPGLDPIILSPVTTSASMAIGMNDRGAYVGASWIPIDDFFAPQQVPTLWEIDAQGNVTATDLTTQIPNKSTWFLLRALDVNNDGWVSVYGRKLIKGKYSWRAVLLIPASQ